MKQYTNKEVFDFVTETHYGNKDYLSYLAGVSYWAITRLYKLAIDNDLGSYSRAIRKSGMELIDECFSSYPAYPSQFQALVQHYQSIPPTMTIEEVNVLFKQDCAHIVSCFLIAKGGN